MEMRGVHIRQDARRYDNNIPQVSVLPLTVTLLDDASCDMSRFSVICQAFSCLISRVLCVGLDPKRFLIRSWLAGLVGKPPVLQEADLATIICRTDILTN